MTPISNECSICMELIDNLNTFDTQCGHKFHLNCINHFLSMIKYEDLVSETERTFISILKFIRNIDP